MPILTAEERIDTRLAGRYRLDRILGRGGMGVVYEGVHLWTGRAVAVKLMRPSDSPDDSSLERFFREARTAGATPHPNIVEVLDMGAEPDGSVYLVLELLHGESLGTHIRRKGAIRPREAVSIVVPVLHALDALHQRGVIHRDLKPDNIFLSFDTAGAMVPKLLDFGISKRLEEGKTLTKEGAIIGTPHYMAPEQTRSAALASGKSDLWSMGVVLYECTSGKLPFPAESLTQILVAIATLDAVPLESVAPHAPRALLEAVGRAMARDPGERFESAKDLADALDAVARDEEWNLDRLRSEWPRASIVPGLASVPAPDAEDMFGETHHSTGEGTEPEIARPVPARDTATEPDVDLERLRDADESETTERSPPTETSEIVLPTQRPWRLGLGLVVVAAVVALVAALSFPGEREAEAPTDRREVAASAPDDDAVLEPSPSVSPDASSASSDAGVPMVGAGPTEIPTRPARPARRRSPASTPSRVDPPATPEVPSPPRPVGEGANHAPIIVD